MERPFEHTFDIVRFTCFVKNENSDKLPTWICCHCGTKRYGALISRCPQCFEYPKWEYTVPTVVALFLSLQRGFRSWLSTLLICWGNKVNWQ
jgi:hypothetical protein